MLGIGEGTTDDLELKTTAAKIDCGGAFERTLQQGGTDWNVRCGIGKIDPAGDGDGSPGTVVPPAGRGTGLEFEYAEGANREHIIVRRRIQAHHIVDINA